MHLSRIQLFVVTWCATITSGVDLLEPKSSSLEPFPAFPPPDPPGQVQSSRGRQVSSYSYAITRTSSRVGQAYHDMRKYIEQKNTPDFTRQYEGARGWDPRSYAIRTDPNSIPYVDLPIAPLGGGPSSAFDSSDSSSSLARDRQKKSNVRAWIRLCSWWMSRVDKARDISLVLRGRLSPPEPFPPFKPFLPETKYRDKKVSDTQEVNFQSSPGRMSKAGSYVVDLGTCPEYMADIIDRSMAETIDILKKAEERMVATAQLLNRDTKWYKLLRIGQRRRKLRQLPIETENFLWLWQVVYGDWAEVESCKGEIPMKSRTKDLWSEQRQSELQNLIDTSRYIREKIKGAQGRVLGIFCGTSWLRPMWTSDPGLVNIYHDHRPSTYFTHSDWFSETPAEFESYHQFEVWLDPNGDPMHIPAIPWRDAAGKFPQLIALNPRYNMIWANATRSWVRPSMFGHFAGGLKNTQIDGTQTSLDKVLKIYLSAQFIPLLSLLIESGPNTDHLRKHVCADSQGHRPKGMPSLQTGPCWVEDPDHHRYDLVNRTASAWNFAYFVVALYNQKVDWSNGYAQRPYEHHRMHQVPVCWGSNFYIPTLGGNSPSDPNWRPQVSGSGGRNSGYPPPQSISLPLHSPNRSHTMHNPPVVKDSSPSAAKPTSINLKRSLFDPSDDKKSPLTKRADEPAVPPPPTRPPPPRPPPTRPPPTRPPPKSPPPKYEFNRPYLGSLAGTQSTGSLAGSGRGGRPGESSASGGRSRDNSPVPSVPSWRSGPSSDGASTPRPPSSDGASTPRPPSSADGSAPPQAPSTDGASTPAQASSDDGTSTSPDVLPPYDAFTPPRAPSPGVLSSIARCISQDPSISSGVTPERRPIKQDASTHRYYALGQQGTVCDASDTAQPAVDAGPADGLPPAYQPIAATGELYRRGGYAIDFPTCGHEGLDIIDKAVFEATEIARAAQKRLNDLILFFDKHKELWLTAPAAWARQDLTLQSTLRTWEALYGRPKPHFSDRFQTKSPNTAPEKKQMKRRFWDEKARARAANIRDTNRNILWNLLSQYEHSGQVTVIPRNTTVFICGTAYMRPDNLFKGKSGIFDHWFDERPHYFFQYPDPKYRKVGFETGGRGLFGSPNSNLRVPDMMWDDRRRYGEWYNLMIMLNTKDYLLTWETTSQPQFSLVNLRKQLKIHPDQDVIDGLGPFEDGTGYQLEQQTLSEKGNPDLYGDSNDEGQAGPSGSSRDYPPEGDTASESGESAPGSGQTTPRPADAAPDPAEPSTSGDGGGGRIRDDDPYGWINDWWDNAEPPARFPSPGESTSNNGANNGTDAGWIADEGMSDANLPYGGISDDGMSDATFPSSSVSDDGSEPYGRGPSRRVHDYYTEDQGDGSTENLLGGQRSGGQRSGGKPSRKGKERAPLQRRSDAAAAVRPSSRYKRKFLTDITPMYERGPFKEAARQSLPTHNDESITSVLAKRGKQKEAEAAQEQAPTDIAWVQSLDLDYLWSNYLASQILYSTSLSASMTENSQLRKGQQLCNKANACCRMPSGVKVTPHADTFACSTGLAKSANDPYDNAVKNVWNFVFFDLAMYLDGRDWSTGKAEFLDFEKNMPLEEQPPKIKWFQAPKVAFKALANALEPFPGG